MFLFWGKRMAFADKARIIIQSGNGGDGHISFRRELYVPNGGPDGGDGGKGGDLIFEVDKGLNSLQDFRLRRRYAAENGQEGGKKRCHGRDGKDLVVKVPYGTVVRDAESGKVITDMSGDNLREVLLPGGRGGQGNMHYATPTMQAPRYAQPGKPGMELEVVLELKCIADVGLLGFPNVGKSSILRMCSNARPEVANYHFTTLSPHLGVVGIGEGSFVMADIPGLIEGASEGAGLGHDFLRHIDRCRVLIHVVDAAGTEGRDPVDDIRKISAELEKYDPAIVKRPMIIAANKMDVFFGEEEKEEALGRLREAFPDKEVFPVSAATGDGLKELVFAAYRMLSECSEKPVVYEREYDLEAHRFEQLPISVTVDEDGVFVIEGERIDRMLGYTNLESEKGFSFFQRFMKEQKLIDRMKELGLTEGDTVRVGGLEFEYYE